MEKSAGEMNTEDFRDVVSKVATFLDMKAKELEEREKQWQNVEEKVHKFAITAPQRVVLNIGGTRFEISKNILLSHKGSMFDAIGTETWKPDADGSYYIDRTPQLFPVMLDYLRSGAIDLSVFGFDERVRPRISAELDFYQLGIPSLHQGFTASTLLGDNQRSILSEWIGHKAVALLYKACRDGYAAINFHTKCDNKGPTMVVIKSSNGHVFGGYASTSWDSSGAYKSSPGCFLFTLANPHNIPPTKYLSGADANAIYCHASNGPTFGTGHDLAICNNSNSANCSFVFPSSYKDLTGRGANTFTGLNTFTVSDIEVFLVN